MINLNSAFEDEQFFNFLKDPDSVSREWREYFEKIHGKSVFVIDNKRNMTGSYDTSQSYNKRFNSENNQNQNKQYTGIDGDQQISLSEPEILHYNSMMQSLDVPSSTSTRAIPVKALDENRRIINRYHQKLRRTRISFTHILAWSILQSVKKFPRLNDSVEFIDGKPFRIKKNSINVGLAVDIELKDKTRLMLVPSLKDAQDLTFDKFVEQFEILVTKARNNNLEYQDLADTSVTLTNPGMIGTTLSYPRLFKGQGLVVSTGSIDYPVEFQAVRPEVLAQLAVSKVVNITCTYDHRIINGAENAEFLAYMNKLLLGGDQFYEQIFYSLKIPFEPIKWTKDFSTDKLGLLNSRDEIEKGAHVMQMINAYRVRGHLLASVNPLGFETYYYPELDPAFYGFTIWDLDRIFHADDNWSENNLPLREIIEILRETYCGSTGIEFMHIQSPEKKDWIKSKLETTRNTMKISNKEKVHILQKLIDAEVFENYLHTKFVGSKRFSLEGSESVIVMLDRILQASADSFLDTVVIGMAHRGRLNVLVNIIGKSFNKVFSEFEGVYDEKLYQGSGDVKYHLGDKGVFKSIEENLVNVQLSSNPSHLELVNPVVEGMARALENQINDRTYSKVLPVLLHGDAAFAGQGIVQETLNMSQLDGYKTGGTIHIIINNQIGFTTTSDYARSTIYASDVAKMIQTPILHVNGNDPEAVSNAAQFAFEYRSKFKSDVIIDMLCYRKYGHNESDEPTYTQPLLYKKIKSMPNISSIYESHLFKEQIITKDLINDYHKNLKEKLDAAFQKRKEPSDKISIKIQDKKDKLFLDFKTNVSVEILLQVANALTTVPDDFHINPKISALLKKRAEMMNPDKPSIDWAMAELLSLGSLLYEGYEVRFTGQDSQRGTFSQRHAVLTDFINESEYTPLNNIKKGQQKLRIFDSPLSEMAVLGFEYGYSVVSPKTLTLWEAQFGDFANNAQTIVDQYMACSEVKWGIFSSLVMLLPHGYDGQGPEHSSARLERYLQLCAEDNMIVGNFTSPAQYFHALRRQIYQPYRMPMILMTPKGALRHPLAVSSVHDLSKGRFHHIINDADFELNPNNAQKLIFCSGKIFFELKSEILKRKIQNIAVARIEQYYPFNSSLFLEIIDRYSHLKEIFWLQEEPQNMGAWMFLQNIINELIESRNIRLKYIGRKASAATATGLSTIHNKEQNAILENAMNI